ncbi:cellulose biosynthesis protein BcsE [Vibrio hyugaensis]|uniref:Cellulose biosynthesis protein BcsE n=1 Tax=Vibrio hyugaensis TaxID=1534743 RepID=A0ABQ5Y924_9VIBR|nr:cellulose biosynthesis protein BcsE [Vibrio hyugaensis]GLR07034.1 cellulose biosynthesis protein BcsE [Vibrio hyugaensis]
MSLINGLPAITSEQRNKSVYVNLFSHKHMTIEFLISASDQNHNTLLTSFTNKETFISGLNREASKKFKDLSDSYLDKIYFISNKNQKKKLDPIVLAKDIHRMNITKNSNYILFIPDSILSHCSDKDVGIFLSTISKLAHKKSLIINVCIYGHLATSVLKPKLLTNNQYLAGLATMSALDESRYSYFVDFWSNGHGVKSEEEYILSFDDRGSLLATPYEKVQAHDVMEDKADSERLYITKEALGDNTKVPRGMQLAENNQQLLEMLDSPRASTIVFNCSSQSEVQQLALDCYQLRTKGGRQLKLVIRETEQCLRYADEKFLLRAGVNLISPVQVPQMRFMTQVEAIQGQMLTRELPQSLEALLKYDVKFGSKGYLHNGDFSQYCTDVMASSSRSNVNFALIKLNLLPGMSPEECLRLCHIRRDGDVVTACNKALYVLFSAIRHNDIDVALNNIFEFPPRDLFHSTRTFETHYDIEGELRHILEDEVSISDEVSALTTEKQIFAVNEKPMTEVPALFAVKKAISIKEQ